MTFAATHWTASNGAMFKVHNFEPSWTNLDLCRHCFYPYHHPIHLTQLRIDLDEAARQAVLQLSPQFQVQWVTPVPNGVSMSATEKKFYCPFCGEDSQPIMSEHTKQPTCDHRCKMGHVYPSTYAIPESESGRKREITIQVAEPMPRITPGIILSFLQQKVVGQHGHVIKRIDGTQARCMGAPYCKVCAFEQNILNGYKDLVKQGIAEDGSHNK